MADDETIALVVLAAGASRRMGRPKQLLMVDGEPLVRRVVRRLCEGVGGDVVVVLGANADEVAGALHGLAVRVVVNDRWPEGMGISVRCGVAAALAREPRPAAVVVALADQVGVRPEHIARLIEVRRETGRAVVATESGGVTMPPVLWGAEYFSRLLALEGDTGARALLRSAGDDLAVVPAGAMPDLDTPEDYKAYLQGNP